MIGCTEPKWRSCMVSPLFQRVHKLLMSKTANSWIKEGKKYTVQVRLYQWSIQSFSHWYNVSMSYQKRSYMVKYFKSKMLKSPLEQQRQEQNSKTVSFPVKLPLSATERTWFFRYTDVCIDYELYVISYCSTCTSAPACEHSSDRAHANTLILAVITKKRV